MKKNKLYIDCWDIVNVQYPNLFMYIFCGGRGIGKTYSLLRALKLTGKRFMYVRRTQTEMQNCCNELGNPFKTLNNDFEWNIEMKKSEDNALIIEKIDGENINLLGYTTSLTTFGKFRGADFSDVDYIYFDEFINLSNVDTVRRSAFLLFNLIETVNRNREFNGEPPVKVILTSNSNTINDDIIRTLELGDKIYNMKVNKGYGVYIDEDRGLYFSLLETPKAFKDMKSQTALYKLTKGTNFYEMALNNEFVTDYFGDINKRIRYSELIPICTFDRITFYRHKNKEIIFVSFKKANCPKYDRNTLKAFKQDYGFMIGNAIERGYILYMNYDVKMEVMNIW